MDFVVTRRDDEAKCRVSVSDMISDHAILDIKLTLLKPGRPMIKSTYRKYRAIDMNLLRADILAASLPAENTPSVDTVVDLYNTCLINLMDKHAPQRTREFAERPLIPWYNPEIDVMKQWRRKCERLYRRSGLTVHKDMYRESRSKLNALIADSKLTYYRDTIMSDCTTHKSLFAFLDKVGHKKKLLLPDESAEDLVTHFNDYFVQKIARIRQDLDVQAKDLPVDLPELDPEENDNIFTDFSEVSLEQVEKIITSASNATCALDPIPTAILKQCKDELLPTITHMVNLSLISGEFPQSMKKALVKPLIKKRTLDPAEYKNFRPVSNLGFVSKLIERVVAGQLKSHVSAHCLDEKLQSAYRAMHSTETALLKVVNDIRSSLDSNKCVILLMLDLSAAFDTVDYDILFRRLTHRLGIQGSVLKWLKSYLRSRSQCVTIRGVMSVLVELLFGVPQGSVLGPLLFVMYVLPLSDIIRHHGISLHTYADDTQLYVEFDHKDPNSLLAAVQQLESCVEDIRIWMLRNQLKMNDSKTEMIVFAPPRVTIPDFSVSVGSDVHHPVTLVKNLGVFMDTYLSMDRHVVKTCQAGYFQLRSIRSVQRVLPPDALERLVHAFISARLDYCNAVLVGLSVKSLNKLQLLQNSAARVVSGTGKYEHITPVLKALHWLPVRQRIDYKILIMAYKALHDLAPGYIHDMISQYIPTRTLRSQDANMLVVPRMRLKTVGQRTFSYAAPSLWNKLPDSLRQSTSLSDFKCGLKTYLFGVAYL